MRPLYVVNKTTRQDQYKKVLRQCLIPQLQEWFQDGPRVFMQDSAPIQHSKICYKIPRGQHNFNFAVTGKLLV